MSEAETPVKNLTKNSLDPEPVRSLSPRPPPSGQFAVCSLCRIDYTEDLAQLTELTSGERRRGYT